MYTLTFDKILDVRSLARKFEQIDYTCEVIINNNRNSYSYTYYDDNVNRYVRKLINRNEVNLNWKKTT